MKIAQEFMVKKPVEVVWVVFQDVPSVAARLPGAALAQDKGKRTVCGNHGGPGSAR